MERRLWESLKTAVPVILSDSDIADHVTNFGKWPRALSAAVKGSLKVLADSLNETCIYSGKDTPEFLVDCIICSKRGNLNLKDFRDLKYPHTLKKAVPFPVGPISYAVEWDWEPGAEAVHFATRDVPKLKYIHATRKVIIYQRVNSADDISRLVIAGVLRALSLGDHELIVIEFERNDAYDRDRGNRLVMNLMSAQTFQVLDSVNVFPTGR